MVKTLSDLELLLDVLLACARTGLSADEVLQQGWAHEWQVDTGGMIIQLHVKRLIVYGHWALGLLKDIA